MNHSTKHVVIPHDKYLRLMKQIKHNSTHDDDDNNSSSLEAVNKLKNIETSNPVVQADASSPQKQIEPENIDKPSAEASSVLTSDTIAAKHQEQSDTSQKQSLDKPQNKTRIFPPGIRVKSACKRRIKSHTLADHWRPY